MDMNRTGGLVHLVNKPIGRCLDFAVGQHIDPEQFRRNTASAGQFTKTVSRPHKVVQELCRRFRAFSLGNVGNNAANIALGLSGNLQQVSGSRTGLLRERGSQIGKNLIGIPQTPGLNIH